MARQLAMPMTSTAMRLNGELFSGSGPERLDWVFRNASGFRVK